MKTVVVCGVGGHGQVYVRELLQYAEKYDLRWVGAVEPFPDKVSNKNDIDSAGVPWFESPEEFYCNHTADLCIISSPIAFHASQSILALQNGSHVLCEKPVAALPSDAAAMKNARDASGKFLGIAYQWSYSDTIHRLKQDILDGMYGKPLRLSTCYLVPRNRTYYDRGSGWAGRIKDSAGHWVLDSVANNAAAHYLHNMFFILGGPGNSIMPDTLSAVLMRANPIEMYDTAFLRMDWENTVISFGATHAGENDDGITSRFEFENGTVTYNEAGNARFTGTLRNGKTVDYGSPDKEPVKPFFKVLASLRGEKALGFSCPVEAALPHNRVMIAALLSAEIGSFPEAHDDGERFFVPGLDDICRVFDHDLHLPNAQWAKPGAVIRLDDPRIDSWRGFNR